MLSPNVEMGIVLAERCCAIDNFCHGRDSVDSLTSSFTLASSPTSIYVFHLMSSWLVCFVSSTSLPHSSIWTRGCCSKRFVYYASPSELEVEPSHQVFLHYYTSRSMDPVGWLSLISHPRFCLFASYTSSYKNFRCRFFKIFVELKGLSFFFDNNNKSKFFLLDSKPCTLPVMVEVIHHY